MELTVTDVLHQYEHKMLPSFIYDEGTDFKPMLIQNPQSVFMIFDQLCGEYKIENKYKQDEFGTRAYKFNDEWRGIVIDFPMPEKPFMCIQAFIIFDKDGKKCGYYTFEIGLDNEQICGFLCSIDAEQNHVQHCSMDVSKLKEAFDEAYKIHTAKFTEIK